jgi:hypothetical protein
VHARQRRHAPAGLVDVGSEGPLAHAPLLDGAEFLGRGVALHSGGAPVRLPLKQDMRDRDDAGKREGWGADGRGGGGIYCDGAEVAASGGADVDANVVGPVIVIMRVAFT